MRRRRKKYGKTKKTAIIFVGILLFGGIVYKLLPGITPAAFFFAENEIDFTSDPEYYTGEDDYDYFNIFGGEVVEKKQEADDQLLEEEAVEVSANSGPKPYPESWKEGSGTVYPYTFERYSGSKFIALEHGGQVMNETDISNGTLIEESGKMPDFKIELDGTPQVLIMHTHTTESFEPYERDHFDSSFNYRTTDPQKNVVIIGDEITRQLENAGIGVIHDTTIHDYPSYNGSYERSAKTIKNILEENPTIKVVLDIHRDAVGTSESIMQPTVNIDGRKAAQVMIISGCDDGTLDLPNYMKNFRFASLLQQQMSSDYPGFARPILFDYRKYNQDLTTGSLLIEVGSHGNTLDQVEYSGELIGRSLAKALIKLSEEE